MQLTKSHIKTYKHSASIIAAEYLDLDNAKHNYLLQSCIDKLLCFRSYPMMFIKQLVFDDPNIMVDRDSFRIIQILFEIIEFYFIKKNSKNLDCYDQRIKILKLSDQIRTNNNISNLFEFYKDINREFLKSYNNKKPDIEFIKQSPKNDNNYLGYSIYQDLDILKIIDLSNNFNKFNLYKLCNHQISLNILSEFEYIYLFMVNQDVNRKVIDSKDKKINIDQKNNMYNSAKKKDMTYQNKYKILINNIARFYLAYDEYNKKRPILLTGKKKITSVLNENFNNFQKCIVIKKEFNEQLLITMNGNKFSCAKAKKITKKNVINLFSCEEFISFLKDNSNHIKLLVYTKMNAKTKKNLVNIKLSSFNVFYNERVNSTNKA